MALLLFKPAAVATGTTWNPADSVGATFSNGNLNASFASTTAWNCCRSTSSRTTGQFHFEYTMTAFTNTPANNLGVGLANASQTLTDWTGQNANGLGVYYSNVGANGYFNNVLTNLAFAGSQGNIIAVELDLAVKSYWVRNFTAGTAWSMPVSFSSPPMAGPYFIICTGQNNATVTLNPGPTFVLTPSPGYVAWG